jgi:translation initiation factor IF-2
MLRPPIVVILGHVDHGKTTLLDALRPDSSSITKTEIGGITQTIGAFSTSSTINNQPSTITFIDTPGHAAFAKMRSGGAKIADVAVLVIAADDGVMPQTVEALEHIKNANVPYVVAVNKIDAPGANIDRIKSQLAEHECLVEGYGGNIPIVAISAKQKTNLNELLEMIVLVYELNGKESLADAPLKAPIIDSKLDRRTGPLVSVIVLEGTLEVGQQIFAGLASGKIRAIKNDLGLNVKTCLPGQPAQIQGFKQVPSIGATVVDQPLLAGVDSGQTENIIAKKTTEDQKSFILRADSRGTLEALTGILPPKSVILSKNVGDVTESDVLLAESGDSVILAFRAEVPQSVLELAKTQKIRIFSGQIIYQLAEIIETLKEPIVTVETELGQATVVKLFKVGELNIAGCKVERGRISIGNAVKIIAGGQRQDGTIKSIKKGTTDVAFAAAGEECGLLITPKDKQKLNLTPQNAIITFEITTPEPQVEI